MNRSISNFYVSEVLTERCLLRPIMMILQLKSVNIIGLSFNEKKNIN